MESDVKVCSCNGIDGEMSDCISKSQSSSESTDNSGAEDMEIVRNTSISEGEIEDLTIGPNEHEKVMTITELRMEEEMLLEKHMRITTQNKRKYHTKHDNDDSDDFQLTKSSRRRRMKVGDNSGGQEICSTRKFSVHDEKTLQAKKVRVRLVLKYNNSVIT
jgi:ribosomal protein L14